MLHLYSKFTAMGCPHLGSDHTSPGAESEPKLQYVRYTFLLKNLPHMTTVGSLEVVLPLLGTGDTTLDTKLEELNNQGNSGLILSISEVKSLGAAPTPADYVNNLEPSKRMEHLRQVFHDSNMVQLLKDITKHFEDTPPELEAEIIDKIIQDIKINNSPLALIYRLTEAIFTIQYKKFMSASYSLSEESEGFLNLYTFSKTLIGILSENMQLVPGIFKGFIKDIHVDGNLVDAPILQSIGLIDQFLKYGPEHFYGLFKMLAQSPNGLIGIQGEELFRGAIDLDSGTITQNFRNKVHEAKRINSDASTLANKLIKILHETFPGHVYFDRNDIFLDISKQGACPVLLNQELLDNDDIPHVYKAQIDFYFRFFAYIRDTLVKKIES